MFRKKTALAALGAVMLSGALTVVPPVEATGSLVNVEVGDITTGDILSNNTVEIAVAADIAANVCGNAVDVGVLAIQLESVGHFRCDNRQTNRFVQVSK